MKGLTSRSVLVHRGADGAHAQSSPAVMVVVVNEQPATGIRRLNPQGK
jgi:hypothetical protein